MARSETASVSAARWLVAVIGAVTLAFLVDTFVTEHMSAAITRRASVIANDAMPSVQVLTHALGNLDQLDFELDRYTSAPPEGRGAIRDRIFKTQGEIEALVDEYALLPFAPYEIVQFAMVPSQIRSLTDSLVAATTDASQPIPMAPHRKIDVLEQNLRRLVQFDADHGQALGNQIHTIRSRTAGMVALLDALCVVLAIFATAMSLRLLRRNLRALEEARVAGEKREAELSVLADSLGQFSGRVAHDILSPLSSAQFSLEMLRPSGAVDPKQTRLIDVGIRAIGRVKTLVDGLLAFSIAGGRPEPGVTTSVQATLMDVLDELRQQATQNNIALVIAPIPAGAVACSAGVLTSLITNLVRNAIRYMGDATTRQIDVRVTCSGPHWRFEVQDTGPGIPVEQQSRIFEPHIQLKRGGDGIGLGLATVQRLVQAHDGALGVTSRPGAGALFWFELPSGPGAEGPITPAVNPVDV